MAQEFHEHIRYQINRYIFDHGYAPDSQELADLSSVSVNQVNEALEVLAGQHALVLHPNSHKIWIAHPFSLMPTLFWVESGEKGWYSNCTWCSLGVASLVENEDVTIYTKLNGTKDPLEIHINNGRIKEEHLLVHFLVRPINFWDNVIYTCSNMLAFDSEEAIDHWCKTQNVKKTEIQPISKIWELAQHWYGYYLSPDWTNKTPDQAKAIFQRVGLTGAFWQL